MLAFLLMVFFFLLKLVVVLLTLVLLIYGLASFDIIFTLVEPGTAKIVMFLDDYQRTIYNFDGYVINDDGDIRRLEELEELVASGDPDAPDISLYEERKGLLGGLHFVGFPPWWSLYRYDLRWSVHWQNVSDVEEEIERSGLRGEFVKEFGVFQRSEEELTEFYLKATPFALVLRDVEDDDNIKISIVFEILVSIRNPRRAAFRVNAWWAAISDNLLAEIRPWAGSQSWEDLKDLPGNLIDRPDFETICGTELTRIAEDWGVEIVAIRIGDVILPGDIPEVAMREYVAERDAGVVRILAEAERDELTAVFTAAKDLGPEGVAMKMAKDLSEEGNTTWVIGAKSLVGSLRDLVGGADK